jgi:hypothetical protein
LVWAVPILAFAGAAGALGLTFARRRSSGRVVVSDEDRKLVQEARDDGDL